MGNAIVKLVKRGGKRQDDPIGILQSRLVILIQTNVNTSGEENGRNNEEIQEEKRLRERRVVSSLDFHEKKLMLVCTGSTGVVQVSTVGYLRESTSSQDKEKEKGKLL
ncbi:hypothetical protein Tco_0878198 [Tanacetum coccineum]|uniref:Uncharacterized protein n=1 Tax=Tanacetum coccineum TaxID=301880 RepID=A0ABQ5BZQ0_9ASTR